MKIFKSSVDKKERLDVVQEYKRVFGSFAGQKVLKDILLHCHLFRSTMSNTDRDTAFKEGERAVGLYLLSTLNIDLNKLQKWSEEDELSL